MKVLLVGKFEDINRAYENLLKEHNSIDSQERTITVQGKDYQHVISAKMEPK